MPFLRDLQLGLNGFMAAFRFAMRHGLGWVFLVPVLLWMLLFVGLFALLQGRADELAAWLAGLLQLPVVEGDASWWSSTKAFFSGAWELLTLFLLKVAIGYVLYKVNKYLVLILLSPLLAYASERAEEVLTGRHFPFSWGQLLKDALRGALIALRNGVLELLITIGLWVLALLFPPFAPVVLVLLFGISAYFYGFSMFDYVFERRRMRIGESTRAVNQRLGAVLANGTLFSLLMKVPLLGVVLGPPMGAIGANIAVVRGEEMLQGKRAVLAR
jgi:CysZ protein